MVWVSECWFRLAWPCRGTLHDKSIVNCLIAFVDSNWPVLLVVKVENSYRGLTRLSHRADHVTQISIWCKQIKVNCVTWFMCPGVSGNKIQNKMSQVKCWIGSEFGTIKIRVRLLLLLRLCSRWVLLDSASSDDDRCNFTFFLHSSLIVS